MQIINWKSLLQQRTETRPDAIAIRDASERALKNVSYRELSSRVDFFEKVISASTPENGRVAVLLPGGTDCVSAFWGAAAAERCYIPLFVDLALDRLQAILADTDPYLVILEVSAEEKLAEALLNLGYRRDAGFADEYCAFYSKKQARLVELPEPLAVILFTSGSTGLPKGIMHTRRTHANAIRAFIETYKLGSEDRVFASIPPHFDAATYDIFSTLSVGGQIIIPDRHGFENPRAMCEFLATVEATVIPAVPTTLRLLISYGKPERFKYESVRSVQPGGEVLTVEFAQKLQAVFPNAVITNMFGPAEIITCSCFHIPRDYFAVPREGIPVGKTYGNGSFLIMEDGELLITGDQLMLGYWNNRELTQEKIRVIDGIRYYATGDIVQLNAEGQLEFKGRRDRMIKRRGIRIELDDIQKNLEKLPGVAGVGVVAKPDPRQGMRIIAHIQGLDGVEIDPLKFKDDAREVLPDEMVPDKILVHVNIPRTSTGKIDLQSLVALS